MKNEYKQLADNIRIERLRRRYSQDKLAEMATISPKYLNLIENCKCNPTIQVVLKICSALDMELNSLLK